MREVRKDDTVLMKWSEEYGSTFGARVVLGNYKVYTVDPRALSHILNHTDIYPKPEYLQNILASMVGGRGLLLAEGEEHKRQRRIMNPSFSLGHIKEIMPIFFDTAHQLRDSLNSILAKVSESEGTEIDMFSWVTRAALDVIGQAGFGYRFNALHDESNELFCAVHDMIEAAGKSPLLGILMGRFQLLRHLPLEYNRKMTEARATTRRIGMALIRKEKAAVQQEMQGKLEKSNVGRRDLLSALIRANMSPELALHQRMSDDEVLAQISTFIVAGHETTASGLAWTLYSLSLSPRVQDKLRLELQQASEEAPCMEELSALPYLDAVLKESLRLWCPVRSTVRVATRADQIPLSTPLVDRQGRRHDYVQVQAGDVVGVESVVVNHAKEFWGEDAHEFRPERWEEGLEKVKEIPGVWAHTMAFLGGARACIGYRFSVMEMKAILFTLIRAFEFAPIEGQEIGMKDVIVIRPFVKEQKEKGIQLPLRVCKVHRAA
ncbi:cytochrome P450 [Dacryopinax primogenitus]|uniref:Cytochrome P450 n=1 Tax=Dacryopinax primogenitus (strain DJM 731) TaxID=1858805 RepID=M5FZ76_DACPD|nr:cytochrome P450 [Dacryopinax primogenitus]EJU01814.1 cytochrome P450 [Dacryopinax primogenitus]